VIEADDVSRALHALFIAVEGTQLRQEERKKAIEVTAFLRELAPRLAARGRLLVDAAAGKSYVGLLAAALLGAERVHVIERAADRAAHVTTALTRLGTLPGRDPARTPEVHILVGDVADPAVWPAARPDVVAALHACGAASDLILDAAVAAQARWLYLVPCCYAHSVPFSPVAEAAAERLALPKQAAVRRRFITSLIDAERTLRLEAGGYEVTVGELVPPTVTPHNLLWRCRRIGEPRRMAAAAQQLERLRASFTAPAT
jgi:hypothetical protein